MNAKSSSKRIRGRVYNIRVNFTNILWAAFTCADPKSAKKAAELDCFFVFLGSSRAKVARWMLVKLTPGFSCYSRRLESSEIRTGKTVKVPNYTKHVFFSQDFACSQTVKIENTKAVDIEGCLYEGSLTHPAFMICYNHIVYIANIAK